MISTSRTVDLHGRRLPAFCLALSTPLFGACSPLCSAIDTWTWGSCHADIHGGRVAEVGSATAAPVSVEYAEIVDAARAQIRALLVEDNLPGLSVAVGVDGTIVWAEGFGWADIAAGESVTPATRFRIGAVAETMTAVATGLMIERGRLDIDRPVRDYVPAFPEKRWPVTTRELMGHVAGMHPLGVEEMLYLDASCTGPLDAIKTYSDNSLLFEPGTAYRHSTDGWKLVAAVVESAAGESFLDFMEREIFDRIGMTETVPDNPAEPAANTTFFYWPFANLNTRTGVEYANNPDNSCELGGAGLLTTPSDLVRFGAAVIDGRLIEPDTRELLQTPVSLPSGALTGHGLGWSVWQIEAGADREPTMAYGADGRSAGGTTVFLTLPEYGIVIAMVANVSYARNLHELAERFAGLFTTLDSR